MMAFFSQVVNYWDHVVKENRDTRVDGWVMMDTLLPSFLLTVSYFYITLYAGPRFMEKRKPYNLRTFMVVYNLSMVVLSAYIFMEFLLNGWAAGYSLGCQPVDYSSSPKAMRMANACWFFFISKFIEFLDTFIFILRKKYNQVSFLHVFHHSIMPISWWFGVRFVPGGFGTFHAMINSLIHFVMYTYYGLSACGPAFQKYLWWKKYMTSLQLIQFLLVIIHASQLIFIQCDYPMVFVYVISSYAFIFIILFSNFYKKTYRTAKPSKTNGVSINGKTIGSDEGTKAKEN